MMLKEVEPLVSVPKTWRVSHAAPNSVTPRAVAGTSARLSCTRTFPVLVKEVRPAPG